MEILTDEITTVKSLIMMDDRSDERDFLLETLLSTDISPLYINNALKRLKITFRDYFLILRGFMELSVKKHMNNISHQIDQKSPHSLIKSLSYLVDSATFVDAVNISRKCKAMLVTV
jgi:hypothetical protein